MKEKHTLRSFDEALEKLTSQVGAMGEQVVQMVDSVGTVLRAPGDELAKSLVSQDLDVDCRQNDINAAVVDVLSRFNPVARDLREVLAMEHVAANLERVGDHAKNIAKRSISISKPAIAGGAADILNQLHLVVLTALRDALRALKERDLSLADCVCKGDEEIDRIFDDLFHVVVADLKTSVGSPYGEAQALFMGKSLERIGDHATNIAEEVRFLTKGDLPSATREA